MNLINQPELYESTVLPEDQKERLRVSGKDLALGVDYDKIDASYPTTASERYDYKKSSVIIRTVLVTYQSASKKDLLSVEVL